MAEVQLIPLGNYSCANFIPEEMGTLRMKRRKWEPSVHLLPLTALTVSLLRAPLTSGLTQTPHTELPPLKVKGTVILKLAGVLFGGGNREETLPFVRVGI